MNLKEQNRSTLKKYFETGDRPTEDHFRQLIDSFVNKIDDGITVSDSNNVGIGTNDPTAKLEVKGEIKSTGAMSVGTKLTVHGEMEVIGKMTTRKVDHHEGDVQLGDHIDDKIKISGTLQSDNQSTSLKLISPLEMTKGLHAEGNITTDGNLNVLGNTSLGDENADQPKVVTIHSLLQSGREALIIKSKGNASATFGLKIQSNTGVEHFAVRSDGRVGIGTVDPDAKLDVDGTVKATAFSGDGAGLTNIDASEITTGVLDATHVPDIINVDQINAKSGAGLKLFDDEGNGVFIQQGGQVGVGITSPKAKLHIYDLHLDTLDSPEHLKDSNKYHLFIQGSATSGKGSGLAFGSADKVGAAMLHVEKDSGSKGDLAFYTKQTTNDEAPVEVMRLDDQGNVGIGTSDPSEKLEVDGTVQATAFSGDGSGLTNLEASEIKTGTIDAERLPQIDSATIVGDPISDDLVPDVVSVNELKAIDSSGLKLSDKNNQGIFIKDGGHVGIDVSNPTEKLEVNGNIKADGLIGNGSNITDLEASEIKTGTIDPDRLPPIDPSTITGSILSNDVLPDNMEASEIKAPNANGLKLLDQNSEGVFIEDGGNVGVGTSSPDTKLHIYDLGLDAVSDLKDPAKYHLLIQGSSTANKGAGIAFGSAGKVGAGILHIERGSGSKGDLAFYTKQTTADVAPIEALRIRANGNVGIGTNDPNSKLDVDGIITAQGFQMADGSSVTGSGGSAEALPILGIYIIGSDGNEIQIEDYDEIRIEDLAQGIKIVFEEGAEISPDPEKRYCTLIIEKPSFFANVNQNYNHSKKDKSIGFFPFIVDTNSSFSSNSIQLTLSNHDIENLPAKLFSDSLIHIELGGKYLSQNNKKFENDKISLRLKPKVKFKDYWGEYGSGDGQFQWVPSLALDQDGNMYVLDTNQHRIQKFDKERNFIIKWGGYGTQDGQFNSPYGIDVDNAGQVFVCDYGNHRIQVFDTDGNFVSKWGSQGSGNGQLYYPRDVAVEGDKVYVADSNNHRIQIFSTGGDYQTQFGSSGTENGQFQYTPNLAVRNGKIYVTDSNNHRIQVFTIDGEFVLKFGQNGQNDGDFNHPQGVAADDDGNIFVADSNNYRIQKFNSSGEHTFSWGSQGFDFGQFNYPYDVEIDANGVLYVADHANVVSFEIP
ncbi:6-bladed beta-propeller [Reichenbachiella sp.]|uniref:6-bladed beta-propeller n=1 Tax=Reichenbachiella sp. TaxID=2184521 RepID=UPI003296B191